MTMTRIVVLLEVVPTHRSSGLVGAENPALLGRRTRFREIDTTLTSTVHPADGTSCAGVVHRSNNSCEKYQTGQAPAGIISTIGVPLDSRPLNGESARDVSVITDGWWTARQIAASAVLNLQFN
jgi:hypothetical protein